MENTDLKKKIVVAEDSPDAARILIAILEKNQFDVTWLKNGQEALDWLRANSMPDLLITDIMMPGISGFELMTHLNNEGIMPPTLVVSGCQREDDVLRGLQYGAEDYISKPFSPKIVMAKVLNVLAKKTTGAKRIVSAAMIIFSLMLGANASNANADPFSTSFGTARSWSEKYTGWFGFGEFNYQASQSVLLKLTGRSLNRDYGGNAQIKEIGAGAGAVVKTSWGYLDVETGYTPEPVTFSKLFFSVDTHYLQGKDDLGLMLSTQRYESLKVYTVRPSVLHEFANWLKVGASGWFVNTPEWVISGQPTLIFIPSEAHQIRIDGAFGRTVEDANTLVQFKNISVNYRLAFNDAIAVTMGAQRYSSDTRTENSVLASLEFK